MSLAIFGLVLWLLQSAASGAATAPSTVKGAPVRPKAPDGLSWEDADQITETVARLERRLKAGKPASREPITISERQFNSYVTLALGPKLPAAVSGLSLRFEPGVLAATGQLDLDAIRSKVPPGSASGMASLLSGTVPVTLRGRFSGANGQGKVEVDEAVVGGIHLPAALVAQLVAQATRTATDPAGFDLMAPFPLPWTARSIRLEAGRAVVDFTQPATH